MNLDKYIRISLMKLSEKYKIVIVALTVANDGKINKVYRVNYENKKTNNPKKEEFKSKRDLARWLMCLQ